MQLVQIEGPTDIMRRLPGIEGLHVSRHSARLQAEGRWQVSAYATDDAVAAVQRDGCAVRVVMTHEEVQSAIAAGRGGAPTR